MKTKLISLDKLNVQSFITGDNVVSGKTVKGGITTIDFTDAPQTNMLDCTCIPPFTGLSEVVLCIPPVGGGH